VNLLYFQNLILIYLICVVPFYLTLCKNVDTVIGCSAPFTKNDTIILTPLFASSGEITISSTETRGSYSSIADEILSFITTNIGSVICSNKNPLKLHPKSELKGLSYLFVKIIFLTDLLIACISKIFATSLVEGFLVKLKFKSL